MSLTAQEQASSGLTLSGGSGYSIGDTLGAGWVFTSMATSGGQGFVTGVCLIDKGDVTLGVDLYFADQAITFGTDNALPSISGSDAEHLLPAVGLSMIEMGGVRLGYAPVVMAYKCAATSLYVYALTRDGISPFNATTDLRLKLLYET